MFRLAKITAEYLTNALPNRALFKTASPEAKSNILRQLTRVIITGDQFLNDEFVDVNGCLKLQRNRNERTQ